jgi:CMP-N,N'-diacetyllegionaminic acid synthase
MKILFTICGRSGSKGIKNKNIRTFIDKPLAYYTISIIDLWVKSTKDVQYDIVLSTDSQELINLINKNPLQKVNIIHRREELCGDSIGKIAVVRDCMEQMQNDMKRYDMIIDLDITSPLRTIDDLNHLIQVHGRTGADVTTSVTTARRNPYFNQLMKTERGYKKVIQSNYTARQQAPEIFDMNASMYAYSPDFLESGKGVLDGYCECIEMMDTGILDLDHENDFELMEVIAKYLFTVNAQLAKIYNNISVEI